MKYNYTEVTMLTQKNIGFIKATVISILHKTDAFALVFN